MSIKGLVLYYVICCVVYIIPNIFNNVKIRNFMPRNGAFVTKRNVN